MTCKALGVVGVLLVASLATAHAALAQQPEKKQPRILAVHADVDITETLFIRGIRFGFPQGEGFAAIALPGGRATVLTILDWTDRKIEAALPDELLPPSPTNIPGLPQTRNQAYKVFVSTGQGLRDELDLTIKPRLGEAHVDPTQVQLRVGVPCAAGFYIRAVNPTGTVVCEADLVGTGGGDVTAVTATPPLFSTGGPLPDISLPGVIIGPTTTAIGTIALSSNTSSNNTASGSSALSNNTTGFNNTASGFETLRDNTGGFNNTASGSRALRKNTSSNNTASGSSALSNNTTGSQNTASGVNALLNNSDGFNNTASGFGTLFQNITGSNNTAIGFNADVTADNLTNATVIGASARVDASNKIRLGNTAVTVIEGRVAFTAVSDRNQKENFQPLDGHAMLEKIRAIPVQSWNYIGQDPTQFRHYGPVAQDFFAAFGHDAIGTIGTPTTINSGDMQGILMIAIQALEERTAEQRETITRLQAANADLKVRLEDLEQLVLAKEALLSTSQ